MQFNSIQYIAFLAAVTAVYYVLPLRLRQIMLVAASFAFYMAWNKKCILLMAAVILVTYGAAVGIRKYEARKKLFLYVAIGSTLALLFYFKYLNFVLQTICGIAGKGFEPLDIILPVGISFYVFQSIGYVVDVYRDKSCCETDLLRYALFVSFFPQLVAGPIERSANMQKQLNTKQPFRLQNIKQGVTAILVGLVEKVVIADRLSVFVKAAFGNYQQVSRGTLIFGVIFFSFQVYCDFNAYSLIAVGSARLLGYRLMRNFNNPYLARSFADYWARWHISLSTWFEDYIFTPFVWSNPLKKLGSAFQKPPMKTGLLLVFFISGLWHGADWTFVIWGLMHAAFRIFEAATAKKQKKLLKKLHIKRDFWPLAAAQVLFTFVLNGLTYVFFCASDLRQAVGYLGAIARPGSPAGISLEVLGVAVGEFALMVLLITALYLIQLWNEHRYKNQTVDDIIEECSVPVQSLVYAGLLLLLVTCGIYGANYVQNPFVYFQF